MNHTKFVIAPELSEDQIEELVSDKLNKDFDTSKDLESNMFYRLIKETHIEAIKYYQEYAKNLNHDEQKTEI